MIRIEMAKANAESMLMAIASRLNGEYLKENDEKKVSLSNENGQGWIKGYELEGDISLMFYDIVFYKEVEYIFSEPGVSRLCFIYILNGHLGHKLEDQRNFKTLNSNQNIVVEVNTTKNNIIRLPKNTSLKYVVTNVCNHGTNPFFKQNINSLSKALVPTFSFGSDKEFYFYAGGTNLETLRLVEELFNIEGVGVVKSMNVNGTVSKIIASQISEHEQNHKKPDIDKMSKMEVENCKRASNFIMENISRKHTVKDISRIAGMNSKRLQQCFKSMYQKTIIDYVNHQKLEKSREWLIEGELNISEISDALGFSNSSYFSLMFKKAYDISPLSFRKKNAKSL